MIKLTHAALLAGVVFVTPVVAQEAPAPAPATPAAAPAPVSDAEVTMFAKAAIAVDKITKDTNIPAADKGKALADAVVGSGIQPERFNEIANASGTDAALQQRIQTALAAEQNASPTAAAPAASTPADQ